MTNHIPDGRELADEMQRLQDIADNTADGTPCGNSETQAAFDDYVQDNLSAILSALRSAALPKQADPSREELAESLIQDAIGVLHHDTTDGSDVDKYERECLRKKFSARLKTRLAAKPVDDGVREALKPFSDFMAGSAFDKLPDEMPLTNGSGMARRQLTVGDFRKLREAIWPPKPHTLSHPSPGERK